jgi:hypothetical protein
VTPITQNTKNKKQKTKNKNNNKNKTKKQTNKSKYAIERDGKDACSSISLPDPAPSPSNSESRCGECIKRRKIQEIHEIQWVFCFVFILSAFLVCVRLKNDEQEKTKDAKWWWCRRTV